MEDRKPNMDLPGIEILDGTSTDSDDSVDLQKAFWRGREVNTNNSQVSTEYFFDKYLNPGVREINELHIKKELESQSLEALDDYRNQQHMGLAGPDGYCPHSTDKKELEEGHLYKMNAIKRNNRKYMIDAYNERQKKIKELESLLADLKKEQKHEEFLKSLPPILEEKVRIYRGKDIEQCLDENERKEFRNFLFDKVNTLDYLGPQLETYSYYTGTECDEIVKEYQAECKKRVDIAKARMDFDEQKRLYELKTDMEKLGITVDPKVFEPKKPFDFEEIKRKSKQKIIPQIKEPQKIKTCNTALINVVGNAFNTVTGWFGSLLNEKADTYNEFKNNTPPVVQDERQKTDQELCDSIRKQLNDKESLVDVSDNNLMDEKTIRQKITDHLVSKKMDISHLPGAFKKAHDLMESDEFKAARKRSEEEIEKESKIQREKHEKKKITHS